MSQKTRTAVRAKQRDRYARAGKEHKTKISNELVVLFDCHRKAAIRALQARPVIAAPLVIGRPTPTCAKRYSKPAAPRWPGG